MKHAFCSPSCFCKASAMLAVISVSYNLIYIISLLLGALLAFKWNVPISSLYPSGILNANLEVHD